MQCVFNAVDPGTAAQRRHHATCVWCNSDRLKASVANRTAMGNLTRSLDAFAAKPEVLAEARQRIQPFLEQRAERLHENKKQRCTHYNTRLKQAERDRQDQEAKQKLERNMMGAEDHRTHKWMP